jgi:hypothetical protein
MTQDDRAACDDCDWQGKADECAPIRDPSERLNAGSEVPAGECPLCGCLAYIVNEDQAREAHKQIALDWSWIERWPA